MLIVERSSWCREAHEVGSMADIIMPKEDMERVGGTKKFLLEEMPPLR